MELTFFFPSLNKTNYTLSIHSMYLKYTTLGILKVYYMYTFSIHLMYTFCISNLEQLEVYKRYTSQKKTNKYTSRFCNQQTPQKVYILYTYTQSILIAGLRPLSVLLASGYTFCIPLYNMEEYNSNSKHKCHHN